jgi:hypothetical protein
MSQEILIWDRADRKLVAARFHEEITCEQLAEAELQWKPYRENAAARLLLEGKSPKDVYTLIQHVHWDWIRKAQALREGLLTVKVFGIEAENQWQGLVMVELASHFAELAPDRGKPLVYVEFLESAPWNLREMCETPRFGLIGVRLMEAVARLSIQEGFHGRVGLLALPQAELFYQDCLMIHIEGMIKVGMKWYEWTRENAAAFLGEKA